MLQLITAHFVLLVALICLTLAALLWLVQSYLRDRRVIIYTSRLSPFCLKLEACLVAGSIEVHQYKSDR